MNVTYGVKMTIAQEVLWDIDRVNEDLNLSEDCKLDSNSLDRVILRLETLLGITIDPKDKSKLHVVEDLIKLFKGKLQHTQV
ncbi:acyl carrier protein [Persicobacter sp. CCB-QB2]|uniref:acyl carrier protein n=1 Tax=Persicobacter sp. CCB-QB2 TaxID=1561025 RepID=UPI0006A9C2FA|nr:acyl carrier protein [Persicobacter sp. CCB-QB2]